MTDETADPTRVDRTRAHPARIYDYILGGHDNYEVDHTAARQVLSVWPQARTAARVNRAFMRRATHWLAAEAGIGQFLDIGTGIPTEPNLHQVAQDANPAARVVYTDNDPLVLRYAEALMTSTPQGRTAYLHADVTAPHTILDAAELRSTLDLDRPVALSCNALFHFIPDRDAPHQIMETLLKPLAPGSFLALSHATPDFNPEGMAQVQEIYHGQGIPLTIRAKDSITPFLAGLELVTPGLVPPHRWKPDRNPLAGTEAELLDAEVSQYAAVARKV
ncbi:SAM-dependent methyltransferase [Streptomyces sp. NBC_01808]|uniref:SAM-dependent methyltransferase n=1 Tax=Streptomyces sp. NBC_01808 TaxID=2975947 RepID=UPI002DDC5135|nr:SAM-dependent methyltransferase [Streptomyces sp. NBC_01808]WSA40649.1 SAM-dependent methyltransferase [Streptomyces sp. NBC_01808]